LIVCDVVVICLRYAIRGDDSSEKERQQKEETAKNAMAFVEKFM
jgi:hypothetical protein